jgi:hypothetical protein
VRPGQSLGLPVEDIVRSIVASGFVADAHFQIRHIGVGVKAEKDASLLQSFAGGAGEVYPIKLSWDEASLARLLHANAF